MKYFSNLKYDSKECALYFTLTSRDTSMPNAIKRIMQAEMPTYALDIHSADIQDNMSITHNEKLLHTLSMVPVDNGMSDANYDEVSFSLDAVFDKNKTDSEDVSYEEKNVVYTEDINSSDGRKYFMSGIPLTEVRKKDKVMINSFKLKRSIQREHVAFQACIVAYKITNIEAVKTNPDAQPVIDFVIRSRVTGKPYPHDPRVVLRRSIEILLRKMDNLKNNIDNVIIDCNDETELSTIIIEDEDHTLGYLLQSHILEMPEFKNKRFVGYHTVHPLKRIIEIKMTHPKPREVIVRALNELSADVKDLEKDLKTALK